MVAAIKAVFVSEFGGATPPTTEDAIATAMANVIAVAIEEALTEVKDNAEISTAGAKVGSDTLTGSLT